MPSVTPASLPRDADRIRAVLATAGRAWTRPRAAVLQVLVSATTPMTAEEIHERLGQAPGGRGINLSSVYRTVNLFRALRIVRRVQLLDGTGRYELAEGDRAHHHHFVCEGCGRIEDVRACPLEGADLGATVRTHHLELYGYCEGCAPRTSETHVRA